MKNIFDSESINTEELLKENEQIKLEQEKNSKKIRENFEKVLGAKFKELFDKHENLEWYAWRQYRNYYNDGDTCHFRIRYSLFKLKDFKESICLELDQYPENFINNEKFYKPIIEDDKKIIRLLLQYSKELEYLYGDHSEITIYKSGRIVIEDFSEHK